MDHQIGSADSGVSPQPIANNTNSYIHQSIEPNWNEIRHAYATGLSQDEMIPESSQNEHMVTQPVAAALKKLNNNDSLKKLYLVEQGKNLKNKLTVEKYENKEKQQKMKNMLQHKVERWPKELWIMGIMNDMQDELERCFEKAKELKNMTNMQDDLERCFEMAKELTITINMQDDLERCFEKAKELTITIKKQQEMTCVLQDKFERCVEKALTIMKEIDDNESLKKFEYLVEIRKVTRHVIKENQQKTLQDELDGCIEKAIELAITIGDGGDRCGETREVEGREAGGGGKEAGIEGREARGGGVRENSGGEEFSNVSGDPVDEALTLCDSVKTVTIDESGHSCEIDPHISISIPPGALANNSTINITIGVIRFAKTDHFSLPDGLILVSPIIWICATPEVQLLKPATITLPHCVDRDGITCTDDLGMVFGKAHHTLSSVVKGRRKHSIKCLDNNDVMFDSDQGVLRTQHFCCLCILAKITPEKIWHCLVPMVDRKQSKIVFYICCSLPTCISELRRQFGSRDILSPQRFQFLKRSLTINYPRILHGWTLPLEKGSNITPESVCNFKIPETSNDDLLKMIQNDIYPPNFVISTWPGSNSVTTILKVSFVGAENELKVEIKLSLDEPELMMPRSPSYTLPSARFSYVDGGGGDICGVKRGSERGGGEGAKRGRGGAKGGRGGAKGGRGVRGRKRRRRGGGGRKGGEREGRGEGGGEGGEVRENADGENFSNMLGNPIGEGDLVYVMEEVMDMAPKWNQLGLALGLSAAELNTISSMCHTDPTACLREMLHAWLQQRHDTIKFGQPSWRVLCKAIHTRVGGSNPGLARKIAGQHSLATYM